MAIAEYFDLYDAAGRRTGRTKERAAVHRDGDWHRSIHVWVVRSDGTLVFQQRAAGKDTMPGRLTATVGGHYAAGETLTGVLRETREEIGVAARESDLLPLGIWRYEDGTADPGVLDREWQDVFLWPLDLPLPHFVLDPAEVCALVELQPGAVLALLQGESVHVTGTRYAAGDPLPRPIQVTAADLVPTAEYHRRIARAALSLAAGRTPGLAGA